MKTETQITTELVKAGRELGYVILNNHGNKFSSGYPDIHIASYFYRGWIEFKGPKTKLKKNQEILIEKLRHFGEKVAIIRFLEDEKGDFTVNDDVNERLLVWHDDGNLPVRRRKQLIRLLKYLRDCTNDSN